MIHADQPSGPDDGILRQKLRVSAVRDGLVYLTGNRASACNSCAARTGCGAGALAQMGQNELRFCVSQTAEPLVENQEVTVAMGRSAFLGAAVRAYLLPPLALVGMALIASVLELSNLWTIILSLIVLGLSFLPLRRLDRHVQDAPPLWLEEDAEAPGAPPR
ncbi:MAG: SoxR reducing system RseC family protein [Mangrovicoccus sp.]|nr:SoxR reducing system RseC family protein [Mangrovicoccus sp.]